MARAVDPEKNKEWCRKYRETHKEILKQKRKEKYASTVSVQITHDEDEFVEAMRKAADFCDMSLAQFLIRCAYEKLCEGGYLDREKYRKKFIEF